MFVAFKVYCKHVESEVFSSLCQLLQLFEILYLLL